MQRLRARARKPALLFIGFVFVVAMTAALDGAPGSPAAPAGAAADQGAELYAANCAGCHQPGGEGIIGTFPPLAGNPAATDPAHVEQVIRNGMSGPLEVLGETYDSAMPPVSALDDAGVAAVVAHVVELAGGAAAPADTPATPATPVAAPTGGDIDRGHDLFVGSDRFDSGIAGCSSCHTAGEVGNLGGSSLGPDLTGSYAKLGGEPGLTAWLANPASPTMMPILANNPLSPDEITDLVAFLADAPNQQRPSTSVDGLLVAGLGGLVLLIGGMAIAWRGMRQTYVQRLRSKR